MDYANIVTPNNFLNYRDAITSKGKEGWTKAMQIEVGAPSKNNIWEVFKFGLEIQRWRNKRKIILGRSNYITGVLERFVMLRCKAADTPIALGHDKPSVGNSSAETLESTTYKELDTPLCECLHSTGRYVFGGLP